MFVHLYVLNHWPFCHRAWKGGIPFVTLDPNVSLGSQSLPYPLPQPVHGLTPGKAQRSDEASFSLVIGDDALSFLLPWRHWLTSATLLLAQSCGIFLSVYACFEIDTEVIYSLALPLLNYISYFSPRSRLHHFSLLYMFWNWSWSDLFTGTDAVEYHRQLTSLLDQSCAIFRLFICLFWNWYWNDLFTGTGATEYQKLLTFLLDQSCAIFRFFICLFWKRYWSDLIIDGSTSFLARQAPSDNRWGKW